MQETKATKRITLSQDIREKVFEKYGKKCHYCGCELTIDKMVCDHYKPLSKGGSNKLNNLVSACQRCNVIKSDTEFKTKADEENFRQQRIEGRELREKELMKNREKKVEQAEQSEQSTTVDNENGKNNKNNKNNKNSTFGDYFFRSIFRTSDAYSDIMFFMKLITISLAVYIVCLLIISIIPETIPKTNDSVDLEVNNINNSIHSIKYISGTIVSIESEDKLRVIYPEPIFDTSYTIKLYDNASNEVLTINVTSNVANSLTIGDYITITLLDETDKTDKTGEVGKTGGTEQGRNK